MAYVSDATGQQEIWVQRYPGPGAPIRVSPNSGREFDLKPARLVPEVEYTLQNQPPSTTSDPMDAS
jgi:hypothetical protein